MARTRKPPDDKNESSESKDYQHVVKQRPDICQKLKERKCVVETVVKGSLPKYICKDLQKEGILDRKLIKCIEDRVHLHSKRVVKASQFMNLFVRYLIHQHEGSLIDIEFPEYILEQTFVRQLMLGKKDTRISFNEFDAFCNHENIQIDDTYGRHMGDRNIYSHACRKYITNIKNHLKMNFDGFLNKLLYNISFRKYNDKKYLGQIVYDARCKIHNWSNNKNDQWWQELSQRDKESVSSDITSTVEFIRKRILKCDNCEKIDEQWMKNNFLTILRLYAYILDRCENVNREIEESEKKGSKKKYKYVKLFNLIPMNTIKAHYITVDNDVFEGLYKDVIGKMDKNWQQQKDEYWSKLLRIRRLEGRQNTFSHTLTTDGISVDFHYKKPISLNLSLIKELDDKMKEINAKYAKKDEKNKDEIKEKDKKPRRNVKSMTQEEEEKRVIQEFLRDKRVIGLDPGRANIIFLAEEYTIDKDVQTNDGKMETKQETKVRWYKLTRQHYYKKAKISECTRKAQRWIIENKDYSEAIRLLSENSPKKLDYRAFKNTFHLVYHQQWDILWQEMLKPRWRKNRLTIYGGKKRVFQEFFRKVEKDSDDDIVIAYGSAKFASTSKGELAVPTSRAYQETKSRYPTILTPEFRSTIVKNKDNVRMSHVREIIEDVRGNVRLSYKGDVRGVLWFSNQNKDTFVNRDLNGALNIRTFAIMGFDRHYIFKRTCIFPKERPSDKKVMVKVLPDHVINKMIDHIQKQRDGTESTDGSQSKSRRFKTPYEIVNAKKAIIPGQSGCQV